MSKMHFLAIQQLAIEPPGVIGEVIRTRGHRLTTLCCEKGEELPSSLKAFDGLVVMGGPQSANDTHLPYITAQLALITEALQRDLPLLGTCLGAQLLARAAGGTVGPSPLRELGWYTVHATAAAAGDLLFSTLPDDGMTVFQWHGETFSLPDGGKLLATAPAVPHQAFRMGRCQYGLQFHAEVDAATIEQWIAAGASERAYLGEAGVAAIRSDVMLRLPAMQQWCRHMTEQWLLLAERMRKKR